VNRMQAPDSPDVVTVTVTRYYVPISKNEPLGSLGHRLESGGHVPIKGSHYD